MKIIPETRRALNLITTALLHTINRACKTWYWNGILGGN